MATQQALPGLLSATLTRPTKAAKPRAKRRPKPAVAATAPVEYTTGVDEQGRTTWTLRFPAPDRMLSVNGNVYWRTRHSLTTSWREATWAHARAAKLPTGLARVRLDFELRFPSARSDRDAANYHTLVVKPATDGFGPPFRQVITRGKRAGQVSTAPGYGLIADDTPEFLDGPHVTLGPKVEDPKRCPFGEVVVTITDLSEVPA
ncbi:hypothetical protein ACFFX1_54685 [Dactylosporangium sucinum]|uniref:Uncharacterized protein n=1 Tax=Dactylosporangium sucinum TaxID=1424081 RepID=A0A917U453_9ACTN|nr:hypothetical protein [Dactylosporangium sucinum]GGM53774.1 hypothetical protein GCM10007977_064210 [Dactylosporangium sucinum]